MKTFFKKLIKKRATKLPVAILVCAFLVVGGGIAYKAFANPDAVITPTTGGEAVSIDTTSDGGSGAWTNLNNPIIAEGSVGDIGAGTHTITLPAGWEFNTSQSVHIGLTSGGVAGLALHTYIVTPTATTLTYVVTTASLNSAETLTFNYIQVRPTNQSVGSGNITATAGMIVGVDGDTNFGTLATIAGAVTQIAFTTQPGSAVYGSDLGPQPVVKTQDQFGNDSTNGLASNNNVVLALTGTGTLTGTATLDIGTSAENGVVEFSGLTVDTVGTGNQLSASATGLTGDDSDLFNITALPITVTANSQNRVYGNSDPVLTHTVTPALVGNDVFTGALSREEGENVGDYEIQQDNLTAGSNYTITYFPANLTITAKEITVTADANQTKIYGGTDLLFTYTHDALVDNDSISGALSREEGENVNTYVFSIGTLTAGTNYNLSVAATPTFSITQLSITGNFTADNKTYDGNTDATILTQTLNDVIGEDDVVLTAGTASFADADVADGIIVTASGMTLSGTTANNYSLTSVADTTADITAKSINVTAQADTKIYDGTADSDEDPIVDDLAFGDTITTAPTQAFDNENIGTGKILTASSLLITGGNNNYIITYVNTVGVINPMTLTVTGVATDSKTYDGDTIATVNFSNALLNGKIETEIVTLDSIGYSAAFDNKNVDTGKIVTITGLTLTGDDAGNYVITQPVLSDGVITVAPLAITADAKTKVYGTNDPELTAVYSGFVNGDTASSLTGSLSRATGDNVGTYAITSTLVNSNYNITYVPANLTITVAPLAITADAKTKVYGTNDPELTAVYSGFVNGDDEGDLTGSLSRVIGDNVGTYAITSTLVNSNYNITYVPANLTIIKATPVITWDNPVNIVYGTALSNTQLNAAADVEGIFVYDPISDTVLDAGVGQILSVGFTPTDITNYNNTNKTVSINVTVAPLAITADAKTKVYNTDDPELTAVYSGFVNNDDKDDLTGLLSRATGNNVGTYAITSTLVNSNYSITYTGANLTITTRPITVTPAVNTKVYDKTTVVATSPTITEGTLATGDNAVFSATYDNVNVGSAKTLTPVVTSIVDGVLADMTGNYEVTLTPADVGEITAKDINVTAQTDTKTYDGTIDSSVSPVGDNLEGADSWTSQGTQVFNQSDIGNDLTLKASGASINDGNSGNNYVISYVDTTGSIITKELTVTGTIVASKEYDGTTDAVISDAVLNGVEDDDIVTLANDTSGTFDNKNIGTNKAVATAMTITGDDADNYTLTQPTITGDITTRPITVTPAVNTKVYDKTIVVATSPTITEGTLATGDNAVFSATYDNVNVGSVKTLTPAVTSIMDGALVDMTGNYDVTLTPADVGEITAKAINVTAQTDTKTYDGTTNSSVSPIGDALEGADSWDSQGTQIFSQSDVGDGLTLTASGASINDDNSGNNYAISYVANTTGVINEKEITVTANANQTKIYGEADPVTFTYTFAPALEVGDNFYGALSRVTNENVGDYAYTLGNLSAGTNYTLVLASTPIFSITPLSITGSFTADNKIYDGNTNADILTQTLNGVINGDDTTLSGGTASFADANVANGITVTASGMVLSGEDVGNYSLTSVADTTANILAVALTITADSETKEFGDNDPDLTYQLTSGALIDSSVTGSLTRNAGEAVGVYTINQGTVTAGINYDITYISGTLIIQDTTAPVITNETPTGTTSDTTPVISVSYSDAGSGINVATAIIKIDGTQIPEGFYTKTSEGISYALLNPLSYDFHTVYVEVEDTLGNKATPEWTFQIAEIDEVAPTATQYPTDDSTDVAITVNPYIDFSEAMDEASLSNNVKLKTYSSVIVPASYNIITNGNGTTRVTITPDFDLDYNTQYYFYIDNNVEDLAGNNIEASSWYADEKANHEFTSIAEDVPATTYNIFLNAGWNLISLPLIPTNSDIATVLLDIIDYVDVVQYYNSTEWSIYKPEITDDLTTMEDGKGYWVFMKDTYDSYTLTGTGTEMPQAVGDNPPAVPNYNLVDGAWNLIGFKSVNNMNIKEYVTKFTDRTLGDDSVVWNYKNGNYSSAPLDVSNDEMEPGYGYWLYMK